MLRPVEGEAAEHRDRDRGSGRFRGVQVPALVLAGGQEMEDRPVMPGLIPPLRPADLVAVGRGLTSTCTDGAGKPLVISQTCTSWTEATPGWPVMAAVISPGVLRCGLEQDPARLGQQAPRRRDAMAVAVLAG